MTAQSAGLAAWQDRARDMLHRLNTIQPPNVLLQQITMLGEARSIIVAALAALPHMQPAGEAVETEAQRIRRVLGDPRRCVTVECTPERFTPPPSVQQEAQGAVAWRDPALHAAAPMPSSVSFDAVSYPNPTPPTPVDVRAWIERYEAAQIASDPMRGLEQLAIDAYPLLRNFIDAQQPSADAGDGFVVHEASAAIGWKACRQQVFSLCEHTQDNCGGGEFERGRCYEAKSIAKAMNAFGPEICDILQAAIAAQREAGEG